MSRLQLAIEQIVFARNYTIGLLDQTPADDHELNAAEWVVYDALYAYCQEMVRRGKPDGAFR